MTRARTLGAALFLFLPPFGQAIAQIQKPAPAAPKRVYRIAVGGPVRSLDPAQAESNAELMLVSNLVEPLLGVNLSTGALEAKAAKSYSVSSDGLHITFILRDDLVWSNGERIKAQDFVFSFIRLLEPGNDSWVSPHLNAIRNAREFHEGAVLGPGQVGFRAVDEKTLTVDLKRTDPFLLFTFAQPVMAPVHKKNLDRFGKSFSEPEHWVGNGPFLPTQRGKTAIVFAKNPHHRSASTIQIDNVHILIVASPKEGADLYETHAVDQFGYRDFEPPQTTVAKYSGQKDLIFEPDFHTHFLRLNTSVSPLSQQKFREVLAMAINREVLSQTVMFGNETPAYSLLPPGMGPGRYEPPTGYLYNERGARVQLKELGYCVKGYSPEGCKPMPMLELIHRDEPAEKKIALTLAVIWKTVYGQDRIQTVAKPNDKFLKSLSEGDYQIALDDLAVEPERAFDFLLSFQSARKNPGSISNKQFDKLLGYARNETNWAEARKIFRQAESLLMKEGGIVPLFHGTIPILVSPAISGFQSNIWDQHPFASINLGR